MPLRIAVLVKQVPRFDSFDLTMDRRIRRSGVPLEMNSYCRRAVNQGIQLATASGGHCMVFTLGPPSAENVLREALACGVNKGILITDPALAGSDSLATAKALAAAMRQHGPFDIVLVGRNSVDADTGQVGPQVAELLGLPFVGPVRELSREDRTLRLSCQRDDRWEHVEVALPAVVSCAERLCAPAKAPEEQRAAVPAHRLHWLAAEDLGPGPWGLAASPTTVTEVRSVRISRHPVVLSGPVAAQVQHACEMLASRGLADWLKTGNVQHGQVPVHVVGTDPRVAVIVEPERARLARELLGRAAELAAAAGGGVAAIVSSDLSLDQLSRWGADSVVRLSGAATEQQVAAGVAKWCQQRNPIAVLAPGTQWGREVAARAAARLGAGMTGDAVDATLENGRICYWKPAFGGDHLAAITASSTTHLATVRPGVFPLRKDRPASPITMDYIPTTTPAGVTVLSSTSNDDMDALCSANVVIGVGSGVEPDGYPELRPLLAVLRAELGATRRVTDAGWLPHTRQVGVTGRGIAPQLYVAIGLSGNINHLIGVRAAKCILAINTDPQAPIFTGADIGIQADWHEAVPTLARTIQTMLGGVEHTAALSM